MKKIEVDFKIIYPILLALFWLSWWMLAYYTGTDILLMFVPVCIFFLVLAALCARYVFDIKYGNDKSTE
jgi:hypothetical protein